ncbi:MAG: sugar phosphate isomerase/epimerase family protein [Kiritimatiellia bacterium]
MTISIATDYAKDTGDPSPYLRRIAEAGFTHIHWCHHWNADFIYSRAEVAQVQAWLIAYGLKLLDLHGSLGPEKNWGSPREYERLAGVELVKNRLEMTAFLGGDVVVMHLPAEVAWDALRRSLDELQPVVMKLGVRIALENGKFEAIRKVFSEYSPSFVGLCYDSGHGNLVPDGLDQLDVCRDRLISVHLHDNDGREDQHRLLFSGTVDWERLARIIGASAYRKCVSIEASMGRSGWEDEAGFLKVAYATGMRFSAMVQRVREAG